MTKRLVEAIEEQSMSKTFVEHLNEREAFLLDTWLGSLPDLKEAHEVTDDVITGTMVSIFPH